MRWTKYLKNYMYLLSKRQITTTKCYDWLCLTAYRKWSGCKTSLLKLIEDWKVALDKKEKVALCVTDMSKAFDSLNHKILLQKLSCYGFSEHSIQLVKSYPTNRKNRVRIDSVVNEWKETTRGCPQGSSFGPLLWNVYQSDLTFLLKNIKLSSWCMWMTTNCTPLEKTPNVWKRT